MARYEPRRCPRLETNRVYDTKEERFTTSDEVSDLLNAYDGMMTRIKSLIKTAKSVRNCTTHRELYDVEIKAYQTVLNGVPK